MLKKTKKS